MTEVRPHRIGAFCDWLESIPPSPPFHTHPAFRFYSDLTDAEVAAAGEEMKRRGAALHQEAEVLSTLAARAEIGAGTNQQAVDLGGPDQWVAAAIVHLKMASSGGAGGSASVSRSSLHLVLGYVEHLERRLGIIPDPAGAA